MKKLILLIAVSAFLISCDRTESAELSKTITNAKKTDTKITTVQATASSEQDVDPKDITPPRR